MSLSRRSFVQTLGVGATGAWIASRGREAGLFAQGIERQPPAPLRRSSCPATRTRSAPTRTCSPPSVRPRSPRLADIRLRRAEKCRSCSPRSTASNVKTCCSARARPRSSARRTHVFISKTAALVAAIPAYEECADYARLMGHPVTGVKLNPPDLKMDLDALQQASKGGGMVFFCNPNNPVATAITARTRRRICTP